MGLNRGDLLLVEVSFHQRQGAKIRPAIVVLDSGDQDFIAAPVTSRTLRSEFDLVLSQWQAAGLNVPSVARIDKVSVIPKANVRRMIGQLAADDLAALQTVLCGAFCPQVRPK